jgi:hypothetical protein
MPSFLTERDNILVEELCDAIRVSFDDGEQEVKRWSSSTSGTTEPRATSGKRSRSGRTGSAASP